jgi:ornithine cyclodeaminase/alanine dehydrogenase-like protein (mu-crystallin family)
MKVFDAAAIDAVLDPRAAIDAMGEAFRGRLHAPKRHHHEIARPTSTATLLLMPAWTEAGAPASFVGVKLVAVYPDNATRGVASVQGSYVLNDGDTGVPLAIMDGARLTLHRTAATSAYAAQHLARADARRMTMVGAGALSAYLIRAHVAARPSIRHVSIWNHHPHRASDVAAELDRHPALANVTIDAATDLEDAVRDADIVSCATLSKAPLVRGAWLKPGAHLDLVGAYNRSTREADDEALARASVFIDTPACLTEGGDVAVAIRAGAFSEGSVRADLFALARGERPGRARDDEITLFKSVGAAIEDLAAAILIWTRAGGQK